MDSVKKSRSAKIWLLIAVTSAALGGVTQPAQAEWKSACGDWGAIDYGSKYYVHNSKWGKKNNNWGDGWQCVGRESTNNSGAWKADFDWWNVLSDDAWHIKAFPSMVVGWQWGWRRSDKGGMPRPINWNSNVNTSWSFSPSLSSWQKWDAIYDLWLDPSDNPTAHPTDELMIFLNYTDGTKPGSGYQGDAHIAGTTWEVYRSTGSWQIISFVRKSKTNSVSNLNLKDFINYASVTRTWLNRNRKLLSVQAGFEIWYGKGNFQTWNYNLDIS